MQPASPPAPAIQTVTPGHPVANYSPVIGPGGSPGGGWPFTDYNMMNDPEGNLAGLPAIFTEDGAGGQGGDPLAFVPNVDDNAMAGYGNAGAGLSGNDVINMAVGDASYTAGAQQLQNSDLGGAAAVGIQLLAQLSPSINWQELSYDPNADVGQGFKELVQSAGAQALAAAAGTGACAYSAMKFASSGGNTDVTLGKAAYGALQCAFGAIVSLGKTIQATESTMTPAENAALSVMYHGIFEDVRNYNGIGHGSGVNGGDAIHAFATAGATSGGSTSFDPTMGGKVDFLAGSTYNFTTGGINVAHA